MLTFCTEQEYARLCRTQVVQISAIAFIDIFNNAVKNLIFQSTIVPYSINYLTEDLYFKAVNYNIAPFININLLDELVRIARIPNNITSNRIDNLSMVSDGKGGLVYG